MRSSRFLRQRRIRHPQTPKTYRRVLCGFQDVVRRCERSSSRVSRRTLEVWLHEAKRGVVGFDAFSTVPASSDRFLDFLVREGSIASNPVAELRTKYLIKGSATIVRALLAPEPDRALEALRQLPQFGSVLGDLMRNHVALMRTRGFRYDTNTRMFLRFDRFLQRHPELANEPVPVMLQHWAAGTFDGLPCRRLRVARTRLSQGQAPSRSQRSSTAAGPSPAAALRPPVVSARRTDPAQRRRRWAREWRRPYIYKPGRGPRFCWTSLVRIRRRAHGSARSHCIRCWPSATAPDYA